MEDNKKPPESLDTTEEEERQIAFGELNGVYCFFEDEGKVTGIGYFERDSREFWFFCEKEGEPPVVKRFLDFLKRRHRRENRVLYSYRGSRLEHRYIISELLTRGDHRNIQFPMGDTCVSWITRPELKKSFKIDFKEALLVNSWPTLEKASGCLSYPLSNQQLPDKIYSDEPLYLHKGGEYTLRVCKTLFSILSWYRWNITSTVEGVSPGITLAVQSILIQNMFYPFKSIVSMDENMLGFARKTVYTGRNEVYRRYGENIYEYDIKSHFVSCYDVPIPIGKMQWTVPRLDKGVYADATVKVPLDLTFGPLPHHYQGEILFPVGVFRDWWDMRELRNAVENSRVDVTLHKQLECDESPILLDFKNLVSYHRQKDPAWDNVWKKLGNFLQGKTLATDKYEEIKHIKDIKDLIGWFPLDEDAYFWKRPLTPKRPPYWMKPQVGSRVQAEARIRHLHKMEEIIKLGGEILYCDNDSVFTNMDLVKVGLAKTEVDNPQPGDLVLKDHYCRGYFIRQKLYGGVENPGERFHHINAGFTDIVLEEKDFKQLLKGDKTVLVQENTVRPSLQEILKGKSESIRIKYPLKGSLPGNRIYDGLESKPIVLKETDNDIHI